MIFDFEAQHPQGRKHMAAAALCWLPTNQTNDIDSDGDLPAYAAVDHYEGTDEYNKEK